MKIIIKSTDAIVIDLDGMSENEILYMTSKLASAKIATEDYNTKKFIPKGNLGSVIIANDSIMEQL
jgi:hypothetical protein